MLKNVVDVSAFQPVPIPITSEHFDMLADTGTAMFSPEIIFTPEELQRIDTAQSQLPEEKVLIGDAGEPNLLHVRRIVVDLAGELPRRVNSPHSDAILAILDDESRRDFFRRLLGKEKHLRRCQINRMTQGSFIGRHVDRDSNPDYDVAVVVQLGKSFSGGEFVVHPAESEPTVFRPEYGTVLVSRCEVPHEVLTVNSNERTSLVFFLSDHAGENRRVLT
ncbi:2OG-Fe(II) oxygenase [Agrobacterium sp. rho-8.1]|jgi:hypothetical protein|nr:2OG-Fe(II) oxygenase [Agrobacterium sp. rho-8.1]